MGADISHMHNFDSLYLTITLLSDFSNNIMRYSADTQTGTHGRRLANHNLL